MMTIDEFEEAMDQIAEELPEEFYRELNGGILILPEKRKSPYAKADDLWVLGMYVHSSSMGRLIEIYYGSFCEVMKAGAGRLGSSRCGRHCTMSLPITWSPWQGRKCWRRRTSSSSGNICRDRVDLWAIQYFSNARNSLFFKAKTEKLA